MIEHLVASTLTALLAMGIVFALRRRSASLRFAILFVALLRFTVPTGWLRGAGESLAQQVPPQIASRVSDVGDLLRTPVALAAPSLPQLPSDVPVGKIATMLWLCGAFACLSLSSRRWFHRMEAVRPPNTAEREALWRAWDRLGIRERVDLRIVAADEVPAACGLTKAYITLPDGLAEQLTPGELDAVLAHELAHVARRDNLSAALARIVVSVFWFHPLAWWLEHSLLTERETACDEYVLAHGAARQEYVTGIAKVCRIAFAGPPAYAGITGSNLKRRVAHILSVDLNRVFGGPAQVAPVAFAAVAVLGPMTAGFLFAQQPSIPSSLPGKVQVQVAVTDGDQAIKLLEEAVARNPADTGLRLKLAAAYVQASRFDAAIGLYEDLLYRDPNSADLQFRLAEAYRRSGNLDQALELFERAAKSDPFKSDAMLQQALILDGTGRRDQARPVYERLLKVSPSHAIASNNLAYLIAEEGGDLDRALDLALEARKQAPGSPEVADTVGWVYLKHDMPDAAIDAFRDAVLANFDSATKRSHLLTALDRATNPTAEIQELRILLREPVSYETNGRINQLLRSLPRPEFH